jgi:hypothetical protein
MLASVNLVILITSHSLLDSFNSWDDRLHSHVLILLHDLLAFTAASNGDNLPIDLILTYVFWLRERQ